MPLALAAAQISAAMLAREPIFFIAAALGGLLVPLAWLGYRLDFRARYWAPASIPYYFLSMNLALLLGLIAFVRGTQSIVWTPTARIAASPTGERFAEPVRHMAGPVVSDPCVAASVTPGVAEIL